MGSSPLASTKNRLCQKAGPVFLCMGDSNPERVCEKGKAPGARFPKQRGEARHRSKASGGRAGKRLRFVPLRPPKKHRNFDTMGIKVAVLSFCPNMLISRAFGLLRYQSLPDSNDSPPPIQFSRELNGSGLLFIFKVIVYLSSPNDIKEKHGPMTKWGWIMLKFY